MTAESLKDAIKRELPVLLREDPAFRDDVLALVRQHHPTRGESEDWFHAMLRELRSDREASERKWAEQKAEAERNRAEQARKWEEQKAEAERDRAEQARKWEEQRAEAERDRAEQARKWAEQKAEAERKWEEQKAEAERDRAEQARKWEESNRHFDRVHEEIMAQSKKFDRGIGALGARWGIQSERAFRNALAGILEESFGVEVINVNEFDDEGVVFGRPEQIELDVIIKNGVLLICELKSSIDKAGLYSFERKARFYEARHQRQAQRLIVISPMVDGRARKVAEQLGIEIYHDSTDVESLDTA
ncbi:PD-(D/E)XK nuclease family protein [Thiococcus pfennigii]|uniref:PD-(D/E)XK nuclease family protein n=1 Tax=Thiococcus pfennigii TaxID=1057 RepID=UPI0019089BC7|nr:DUF3782 domain-containing protein [Thiococcus pfennigii]MBK1702588.1 hypothetical protein [Thiococcus pfennigii]